jgi:two-component system NtrC family sensor kinase
MKNLTLFLLFLSLNALSQNNDIFHIDSLGSKGVLLNKGWKYQTGDNLDWAKPDFDDSAWTPIDPTKDIAALPEIFNAQIKWLRLDFEVKNKLPNPLGIAINQTGASEIYLNGHLIHQFGHLDTDSTKVKAYDPLEYPIYFPADSVGQYHLAVRYALQPTIRYTKIFSLTQNRLFNATLLNLVPTLNAQRDFRVYYTGLDMFKIGIYFMLFVLHLAFYFYQRSNKTHLVLAICFLLLTFLPIFKIIGQNQFSVEYRYFYLNISSGSYLIGICMLVSAFYRMAKVRLDNYFYAFVVLTLVNMFVSGFTYGGIFWQPILLFTGNIFSFVIMFRLTRIGLKKEIKGFGILGVTVMIAFFGIVYLTVSILFLNYSVSLITGYKILNYTIPPYLFEGVVNIGTISTPLGLSLFMGIEGNETNKALSKQLVENEQLKNEAIEHEQEKQHILATQNEILEKQVTERTSELNQSLIELRATQAQLIQSEKLASLGELTAGIAHEIQNPLNFVNNFSELSTELLEELSEELPDELKTPPSGVGGLLADISLNLEKINHHGKRAASIVKGMLEHSKASTGKKELTDINALVDEYARLTYSNLRSKNEDITVTIETHLEASLPKMEVIPQDMGRVLLNLMNNAFWAVQEQGKRRTEQGISDYKPTVTLTTKAEKGQISIVVKDNGNGIPESVKAKVFQPFFTTKPTGEGTGLGLSLAYDIVTKGHGGTLAVLSVDGGNPDSIGKGVGSEFIITLPF